MRTFLLGTVMFFFAVISVGAQEDFVYNDHGKRDPFWKLVTDKGLFMNYETDMLVSDLTLEGIISGPNGKNLAIINNIVVKPNDRFGLFVVDKIEENQVSLIKGQESFVLKLKKEE